MFKITRRQVFITLVILLVISGIFWSRTISANGQKQKIETVAVEQKNLVESVTSSGKTQALAQVDLHFQTLGKLAWVGVAEGDQVQAYTAIAALDVRQLKKDLEKTLRDYSKERNDFEEDKQITYKDKVLNDTIKRILEKNQWDLEKAVLDVELDTIAIELSTLVTPITGIVTRIDTPVAGVNVTPANIFTVIDPRSVVFTANIDETDIGKIVVGQTVAIHLDAYPEKTVAGRVEKIAFSAETSLGGATIYPVDIVFLESELIRVGLNGDVSITIKESPQAVAVPNEAVREDQEETFVFKKSGSTYQRTQVTIGFVGETYTQVIDGLAVGDEVVIKGFQSLPK